MRFERIVDDPGSLAEALALRLESEAAAAIRERGRFSIAVPGGSVAERFFPRLAEAAIQWSRVLLFQADERAVAPDDPDSNFALAQRLLLDRAGGARMFRMRGEAADLDRAAAEYADELARLAGTPPRLDVALLGVGEDGHVASLFPGHPLLLETSRLAAAVYDAPKPPPGRLTLTLPVLQNARLVAVAAFGPAKAGAIRALDDPASGLPVARVARAAERCLVLVTPDTLHESGN